MSLVHPEWHPLLRAEQEKPYFAELRRRVVGDRALGVVYPPSDRVLAAFQTPLSSVRAVIVGQDPYHRPGQAVGLAFAVPPGARRPPSLVAILRELEADLGVRGSGDVSAWARDDVLMLNSALTVRAGEPRSHRGIGWEEFTGAVLRAVLGLRSPVAWLLWGADAQRTAVNARRSVRGTRLSNHLFLAAPHPSPLSGGEFAGCRHFSACNDWLERHGARPIDWSH